MKYRILTKTVQKALKTFPAIVVTGPRQSGKTTLLKTLFGKTHQYVNLENPDMRLRARDDPRLFLDQHHAPVIFDEIQYAPELLPYTKASIDQKRTPGGWLLTGSQHFVMMQGISESLAGRAAVLSLLPFSVTERVGNGEYAVNVDDLVKAPLSQKAYSHHTTRISEFILRGFYPEIADKKTVDKDLWCGSYITTYLERDIRNLAQVGDLSQFERFLKLCATRTGQILNLSELAKDIGVSTPTAKRWLSLLETGYQVYLLYPYYKNIGKRIIKSPKLYFNDTALASYLLGIKDEAALLGSPQFPALFETLIVTDFWKRFTNFGAIPSLYYIRTRDGLEVDLVVETNQKLHLFEIKSGATITARHAASLVRARADFTSRVGSACIISQSANDFVVASGVQNRNWHEFLLK